MGIGPLPYFGIDSSSSKALGAECSMRFQIVSAVKRST